MRINKLTRRQILALAGAGAASGLIAVPGRVFGQSSKMDLKIIHSSSSILLLWAVSYIAEDLGYYEEEGINLQRVIAGSGPAAIQALVGQAGDCNLSSPGEVLTAIVAGQKFKLLMAHSNYNEEFLVVSKDFAAKHKVTADSPLADRLAALKASKGTISIGVTSPGSMTDGIARLSLKQVGLNPDTDANIVPLGSTANALAAMQGGKVDAFVASPPNPNIAVQQLGAHILLSVGKNDIEGFKALVGQVVEARAEDVEKNPELFQAEINAETRAMRYIQEQPDRAGELLYNKRFSKLDADLWSSIWKLSIPLYETPYVKKENVSSWITMGMLKAQSDPNVIPYDDVIDMRFVDKAVKKIGWKLP